MEWQSDAERFAGIVRQTMEFYDRTVSDAALRMWWATLADRNLQEVQSGFEAHLKDPDRGRWAPKPADIIAQIEAQQSDAWPGADEAWSAAVDAMDEDATVVWTREAAQAWGVARTIMDAGDEVGARMAFRDAYRSAVRDAVAAGRSPVYEVSQGHDPARREDAIRQAAEQGLIGHDRAEAMLPAPRDGMAENVAALLDAPETDPSEARDRLREIRAMVKG